MNHLAGQKSPYLLQHADNPVDWYPWGNEAFEKARAEQKPIFLSIGYSTCHWCHVMEHESFANGQVAELMNAVFVSIKVDREERPDLDEHFMDVSRLLTGGGGWPLTIIMTHERRPFFAGTYIPREAAYGRMGMLELVPRIHDLYQRQREEVEKSAQAIAAELAPMRREGGGGFSAAPDAADRAVRSLAAVFDSRNGGFGSAPKFPMPSVFSLLLRAWKRTGSAEALRMAERTLAAMRSGGIYDQVGLGFHRYSTDERWLVPHFEKMLYDQAQLALAYTDAWLATGKDQYGRTAREILAYVTRDLSLPEGGFASAEDADSEGEEGKFYYWTAAEIEQLLGPAADDFMTRYRVLTRGNFIDPHGSAAGKNILHRDVSDEAPPGELEAALLAAREKRVRPLRDDKLLTDWNGLTIAALARAGRAFSDKALVQAAEGAARFILDRMSAPSGGLLHRYRQGEAAIPGFADDYAFIAWGLLELYESTLDAAWLQEAVELVAFFTTHFWDPEEGGYFQTGSPSDEGVPRRTSLSDGVIPSANSVAAMVLLKLALFTGDLDYRVKAEAILRLYPVDAPDNALLWSAALCAADFALGPTSEIVIVGDRSASDTRALVRALDNRWLPLAVVILKSTDAPHAAIESLAPFTAPLTPLGGKAAAYVCRDFTCSLPTGNPEGMLSQLA